MRLLIFMPFVVLAFVAFVLIIEEQHHMDVKYNQVEDDE
jgi:hypothetical protein